MPPPLDEHSGVPPQACTGHFLVVRTAAISTKAGMTANAGAVKIAARGCDIAHMPL